LHWAEGHLHVPVIDHWWQTETGWPICANCLGIETLKVKPGSPSKPVAGWDVRVVDPENHEAKRNDIGALVIKLPLPPGAFSTLWNAEKRFVDSYFSQYPGYYSTADAGFMDEDGYVYVMARTDDIINVAGHRLSTGSREEVLASHSDVAECAVIGVYDELKAAAEVVHMVRQRIGPVASFKTALVVSALPKTRSGKVLRCTMQKIADGQDHKVPATIDDSSTLIEIAEVLRRVGYANKQKSSSAA
jgi:propionyl-CoA synthetase